MVFTACGPGETEEQGTVPASWIRVDLDRSDPEPLLRYYFGSYVAPEGGDPFAAGLVAEQGGRLYIDPAALEAAAPEAAQAPLDADANGTLVWDELAGFVAATYYRARAVPATLAALRAEAPYHEEGWFSVELEGVMTTALRRVYVATEALRSALEAYRANGEALLYPVGTTFVGEHYEGEALVETTVMRKRADGYWDYFAYDAAGNLASQTTTPPRALDVPTQCVGCHFGAKLFEPERSFPAEAPPGPHGPRGIYVGDALRDAEVVAFFDEHSKRSDHVLGLYGTLFTARLRAEEAAGSLPAADAALLDGLGLAR